MNGHLGDLLSALLDGELTPSERSAADAHLAECATCRAELAATTKARAVVRALGPVEPPFGMIDRMVRSDRWRRPAAGLAMAAAAAAVVGFAIAPRSADVAPPVGQLVAAHASFSPGADAAAEPGSATLRPVSFDSVQAPFSAPGVLARGYERVGVYPRDDMIQVVYGDGAHWLSVFEQPGDLAWDQLPPPDRVASVGGHQARCYVRPGAQVVTWQAHGSAYTVVGDGPAADVLAAAASLGLGPAVSKVQWVRETARELIDTLS